jgi:tellurite resistance protein TerC
MITIPGVDPIFMWVGFILLILFFLFLDLVFFHRKAAEVSIKQSLGWTAFWISLAMLFNLWIYYQFGQQHALEFFTGYVIEKSLSVDNLFVILVIFTSFGVAAKYQHRVLFWGIVGALIMRGVFIAAGVALIEHFIWAFLAFGLVLFYAAYRMQFGSEKKFDPKTSRIVNLVRKVVPVSENDHEEHFIVRENGRITITVLLLALIVIEFTDVIFAFDSIPAIFAITTDPFIVFTSNLFAILGLRSLYFVLADMQGMFEYLKTGLSVILLFIAVKLVLKPFHVEIPIVLSLIFIAAVLITSIGMSLVFHRRHASLGTPQPTVAHAEAVPAASLSVIGESVQPASVSGTTTSVELGTSQLDATLKTLTKKLSKSTTKVRKSTSSSKSTTKKIRKATKPKKSPKKAKKSPKSTAKKKKR